MVKSFLRDIYTTGCRPEELLNTLLWAVDPIDPSLFLLTPLKGNLIRTIPRQYLSGDFNSSFDLSLDPYGSLSLRQLEYSIKQVAPFGVVLTGNRFAVVYAFRYNRIREYIFYGYTQAEVNVIFGWINPLMSTRYTDAILSVFSYLIPAETYFLNDSNANHVIDENDDIVIDGI